MRTVMVGVQDWVQQYYAFDLVLVHRKGRGERNEKKLKKIVVKFSEKCFTSVHLYCKLIYRALRIVLL
jgi:hypothetical protein